VASGDVGQALDRVAAELAAEVKRLHGSVARLIVVVERVRQECGRVSGACNRDALASGPV
jgi:hypothetical protein